MDDLEAAVRPRHRFDSLIPGWARHYRRAWLGHDAIAGVVIGVAIFVGTLEFVGPNEPEGWALAGTIVPIAYIAWSIWLILIGVFLLIG